MYVFFEMNIRIILWSPKNEKIVISIILHWQVIWGEELETL